MTSESYFKAVAEDWDTMRTGFFSTGLRDKAYQVAGVRQGTVAADLGAGTGFISEGLVERGVAVIAIDAVQEMLDVLNRKLGTSNLITTLQGEAQALPLSDGAVDYTFANMYLHHVEDPGAAIKEMFRVTRPGGMSVITDLDAHSHDFLRTEHNDRWMGFDRSAIARWYTEAGFTDVAVDCVGETCESTSECGGDAAAISVFVASGRKPA